MRAGGRIVPGIGIVRVCCAGALLLATLAPDDALSQSLPRPGTSSNACKVVIDDDDDDSKPVPGWKRFAWEEACVEISGELTAIYQKQKASASRIPLISSRQGTVTNASELTTLNPSIDINTTRQTALGELKTTFSVEYNKTTTDGNNGLNTLSDATVSWAGIKGGYTDTQVYFWDGDFQFSATSPNRTVGLAGYEFKLGKNWTFTLAYETGLADHAGLGQQIHHRVSRRSGRLGAALLRCRRCAVPARRPHSPGAHRRHASVADASRPADAIQGARLGRDHRAHRAGQMGQETATHSACRRLMR